MRTVAAIRAGDEAAFALLVERYMDACERADVVARAGLLREDARLTMPPTPSWYDGRDAIATFFAQHVFGPSSPGHLRLVPTRGNRQPALAVDLRREGELRPEAFALMVLRVEDSAVAEISGFVLPELFPAFGLATSL